MLFIIFSLRIKHFKILFFKGYNHFTGFLRAKLILIPNIRKFANIKKPNLLPIFK